ncbi:hypothetical protein [Polynucleobacter sp. MWH-Jannik1A5]|uniref:hypothetical protein n=1 Tax=Polynucleobacter sp. MWH-Jannik1A5 TaxID=1855890 RepID=UPI001C0AC322|nr:hypothetical protein [Polynucleobacter sp. MWH-Jannik1A5]MBU3546720.1 hypothetical protein [Polynucleobacter sp. MWH-Jannik1A5]
MNSLIDTLRRFSPQILTLIFLGYAPFFGESFRLYFKNPSGFILLAVLLTLVYWRQFKTFILEKNTTQFWWLLITLYCVLNTLPHLGEYSLYDVYLDLGAFFVMLFGLFFGKKIASKVSLMQLVAIITLILMLFSGKILWMWLYKIQALNDGLGFFIGTATYGTIPKIILRGQNPFLISALMLIVGVLLLRKNTSSVTVRLTLALLLAMVMIVIGGVRSIYFAIIPCCIFLGCFLSKASLKKYSFVGILLGIFFISLYLFIGRDALSPNPTDSLRAFPGMDILANNGWWFLNGGIVDKMASGQIPLLNSMSVALKMAEYLDVIRCVNDHWLTGLGMGALCFSPATQNPGNYVHSQPFALYLKGGWILVVLFYGFIACTLFRATQYFKYHPQEISAKIGLAVVIALCTLDILTNQFQTLSGSFYLGFWIGYSSLDLKEYSGVAAEK